MVTVTKKELAHRIASKTGVPQAVVRQLVQALLDEVMGELVQGNRLEFRDFGVFERRDRAARLGRNPRTGEAVQVPEQSVVHFKAGRVMKEKVDKKLSTRAAGVLPPETQDPAAAEVLEVEQS